MIRHEDSQQNEEKKKREEAIILQNIQEAIQKIKQFKQSENRVYIYNRRGKLISSRGTSLKEAINQLFLQANLVNNRIAGSKHNLPSFNNSEFNEWRESIKNHIMLIMEELNLLSNLNPKNNLLSNLNPKNENTIPVINDNQIDQQQIDKELEKMIQDLSMVAEIIPKMTLSNAEETKENKENEEAVMLNIHSAADSQKDEEKKESEEDIILKNIPDTIKKFEQFKQSENRVKICNWVSFTDNSGGSQSVGYMLSDYNRLLDREASRIIAIRDKAPQNRLSENEINEKIENLNSSKASIKRFMNDSVVEHNIISNPKSVKHPITVAEDKQMNVQKVDDMLEKRIRTLSQVNDLLTWVEEELINSKIDKARGKIDKLRVQNPETAFENVNVKNIMNSLQKEIGNSNLAKSAFKVFESDIGILWKPNPEPDTKETKEIVEAEEVHYDAEENKETKEIVEVQKNEVVNNFLATFGANRMEIEAMIRERYESKSKENRPSKHKNLQSFNIAIGNVKREKRTDQINDIVDIIQRLKISPQLSQIQKAVILDMQLQKVIDEIGKKPFAFKSRLASYCTQKQQELRKTSQKLGVQFPQYNKAEALKILAQYKNKGANEELAILFQRDPPRNR